jgi:HPt (histidine-containing phosphotransfer) domain-containing protein
VSDILLAAEVYDRLQQAMASDPDGLRDLYRDFLADARQSISGMRAACDMADPDSFRQKAHYLKSSTSVLGMRPLAQLCGSLEDLGKQRDMLRAPEELDQAQRVLDAIEIELTRRLGPDVAPKSNAVT